MTTTNAIATTDSNKNWAMFCHLSALLGFLIPFGNLFGPLAIWLAKRDEAEFIDENGKEALNFQITISLMALVGVILMFVYIGVVILGLLAVYSLVAVIYASIKASKGLSFRYPLTLRLIS